MTQRDLILNHLKGGNSITTMEAFQKWGITRLATYIHTFKNDGYDIRTERHKTGNVGASYSEYWMPIPAADNAV